MNKAFLTGSRAYGPVTENSDIDIVLERSDAAELSESLETMGVHLEIEVDYGEASSFKFSLPGLPIINIVVAHDDVDFEKWKYATDKMKSLPPVINREERLNIFQNFLQEGFNLALQGKTVNILSEYEKLVGSRFVKTASGGLIEVDDMVNDMWK
jgi:hypothetical protein